MSRDECRLRVSARNRRGGERQDFVEIPAPGSGRLAACLGAGISKCRLRVSARNRRGGERQDFVEVPAPGPGRRAAFLGAGISKCRLRVSARNRRGGERQDFVEHPGFRAWPWPLAQIAGGSECRLRVSARNRRGGERQDFVEHPGFRAWPWRLLRSPEVRNVDCVFPPATDEEERDKTPSPGKQTSAEPEAPCSDLCDIRLKCRLRVSARNRRGGERQDFVEHSGFALRPEASLITGAFEMSIACFRPQPTRRRETRHP
jgi:hypothetical protein